MWPSLVQAPSPPCDLLLKSFSKRSLNLCWCSGKAPVCSGRAGGSPPAACAQLGPGGASQTSLEARRPRGVVKKLVSSLLLAGCVRGTQIEPELRSRPGGSLISLFPLLWVTRLR